VRDRWEREREREREAFGGINVERDDNHARSIRTIIHIYSYCEDGMEIIYRMIM
jgi:hypothetical protein